MYTYIPSSVRVSQYVITNFTHAYYIPRWQLEATFPSNCHKVVSSDEPRTTREELYREAPPSLPSVYQIVRTVRLVNRNLALKAAWDVQPAPPGIPSRFSCPPLPY